MRCPYCDLLIIHRFDGEYTRWDKKRKAEHMRHCEERPESDDLPDWEVMD